MPNKIEEIIAFLAPKEKTTAATEGTAAENPEILLEAIAMHLAEIQQLFISSFQLQCLSSGAINSAPVFAALSNLQSRLMALEAPHANSQKAEIKNIRKKISKLIPKRGQEGRYVYELTKLALWNSTISQRVSIPQGFAGVINIDTLADVAMPSVALAVSLDTDAEVSGGIMASAARSTSIEYSLRKFTFLATHGIGPCVGFLLYSEAAKRLALAHFDDPYNATKPKPNAEKLAAAEFHYQACIKGILAQAQAGLSDQQPGDWKVILATSGMKESERLSEILTKACEPSGIMSGNITLSKWGNTGEVGRSILINLPQFNMNVLLTYEETVHIAAFPKESLTLKQALNLPTAGLSLFRMARGLIPCNPEQGCYIEHDYVTTAEPNINLANRYFAATCSHDPVPVELKDELDTAIAALVAAASGPAAAGASSGQTTKADAPAFPEAASAAGPSAFLPERGGLDVVRRTVEDEHPLLTAARYGSARELEATRQLVTRLLSILAPSPGYMHPAAYATAVATSAIVALAGASTKFSSAAPASTHIEGSNIHSLAIAALAALVAAEKIDFKPSTGLASQRGALGGRGTTAAGRHGFQGRGGREARAAQIGPTPDVVAGGGATKRPLAPSSAAPAAKFPRMSTTISASDKAAPSSDKVTAGNPLENPIAVTTHANPAPVVRPATLTPYITTAIASALVNSIRSKATVDAREAKAAGAHVISPIAGASLALIDALAAERARTISAPTDVATSSMEEAAPAAAASAATILQDPVNSAIQAIIDIPLPEPSDAGLIDRLTVYLAKAAAVTLRSAQVPAPSAGAGVAKPFSFLRPQAGAAAAVSAALPHLAFGPANPAPGDDEEIKGDDDDDRTKPKQ